MSWPAIWLEGVDVCTDIISYRWSLRAILCKPLIFRNQKDVDWCRRYMTDSSWRRLRHHYLKGYLTLNGYYVAVINKSYDNDPRHYGQGL